MSIKCCHGPDPLTLQLCEADAPLYRQCSVKGCGKEIGYCKLHGEDGRAVMEMSRHIEAHKQVEQWEKIIDRTPSPETYYDKLGDLVEKHPPGLPRCTACGGRNNMGYHRCGPDQPGNS